MVLTGGPDCPAGPAGPAGPSSPFTPAGPRSPLAPGWPSAPCREEQWRGQHLGMLSCCLVRICVYDIERWLAAVLQGVQRIQKIQQVQPLHAHPVDNKQTVMKTERTAHKSCFLFESLHPVLMWTGMDVVKKVIWCRMWATATHRGSARSSGSSRSEGTALTLEERTVSSA